MELLKGFSFSGQTIKLDGKAFFGCDFTGSRLILEGFLPCYIDEHCTFGPRCSLTLTDNAKESLRQCPPIAEMGDDFASIIEEIQGHLEVIFGQDHIWLRMTNDLNAPGQEC